ncbi:MAG: 6-pyruvoyl tetrahydropterin synthase family protein [Candidatus Thorarchaeota archaeon]
MYSVHVKDQRMHFSASHFLRFCGNCEKLHGHNYTLDVFITGPLNEDGMVVDFGEVKRKVVKICKTLDHKVMLPGDSKTINVKIEEGFAEVHVGSKRYVFPEEDCIVLEIEATTAELLAKYIHGHLEFPSDYQVKVCVSESAGSTGCYEN